MVSVAYSLSGQNRRLTSTIHIPKKGQTPSPENETLVYNDNSNDDSNFNSNSNDDSNNDSNNDFNNVSNDVSNNYFNQNYLSNYIEISRLSISGVSQNAVFGFPEIFLAVFRKLLLKIYLIKFAMNEFQKYVYKQNFLNNYSGILK